MKFTLKALWEMHAGLGEREVLGETGGREAS